MKNKKVIMVKQDVLKGAEMPQLEKYPLGHEIKGELVSEINVGEPVFVMREVEGEFARFFRTSVVTKIIDENTFETRNSRYHFDVIDEEK